METAIQRGSLQVTAVCLVASAMVLALGLVGATATPLLVVVFLAFAVGLYYSRPDAAVGTVYGLDIDGLLDSLWLTPAVAALPLLVELGASPGEMQALGGILGLVGMANYFLRPVYLLAYDLAVSVTGRRRGPT
jgi:hypothetical protein